MFAVAPAVSAAGHLTFTPAANMFGTASCTVTLTEQMAGGLSVSEPLSIVVTPGERRTSVQNTDNYFCPVTRAMLAGQQLLYSNRASVCNFCYCCKGNCGSSVYNVSFAADHVAGGKPVCCSE
jgi:hypothetical protein